MDDTVTAQDVRRDHAALVYLHVSLIDLDLQRSAFTVFAELR
jgi:hypothetical protein